MDEKTIARFWAKVDKNGPVPAHVEGLGHCWTWLGSIKQNGYGRVIMSKKSTKKYMRAHRFAWALHTGKDAGEMCVLHKCDNPRCVNPGHLFLGTNADNTHDMYSKGRDRWSRCVKSVLIRSANPVARVTG